MLAAFEVPDFYFTICIANVIQNALANWTFLTDDVKCFVEFSFNAHHVLNHPLSLRFQLEEFVTPEIRL